MTKEKPVNKGFFENFLYLRASFISAGSGGRTRTQSAYFLVKSVSVPNHVPNWLKNITKIRQVVKLYHVNIRLKAYNVIIRNRKTKQQKGEQNEEHSLRDERSQSEDRAHGRKEHED